jgi:hypothetical protein
MASARKIHFVRVALRPDRMPTKIAPAKLQELGKRQADWERKREPKPK